MYGTVDFACARLWVRVRVSWFCTMSVACVWLQSDFFRKVVCAGMYRGIWSVRTVACCKVCGRLYVGCIVRASRPHGVWRCTPHSAATSSKTAVPSLSSPVPCILACPEPQAAPNEVTGGVAIGAVELVAVSDLPSISVCAHSCDQVCMHRDIAPCLSCVR